MPPTMGCTSGDLSQEGPFEVVGERAAFVGRQVEVARLTELLEKGDEGIGSMVLVTGEAGVGKTRLCSELSRHHRERGGQSLLGSASIEDASVPFAPLADTLRAARRTERGLWEAALAQGSVLWPVASELAPASGQPERSVDRPVIFEAILDAVAEAAGDRTTLWTIEDIHWADDSTWEFIRYAARRIPDLGLVLLVTYREEEIGPGHLWWTDLVRLKRQPSARSFSLARLSEHDAGRLARSLAPTLSDEAVQTIVERAAGTPLLVEELATMAMQSGRVLAVPDIVQATVRERMGRVGPKERALLEVAAVAGLEVDEELLARLHPGGKSKDLVAAGLLMTGDGRIRFRHPLMQEAAYADIPPDRRRALHAQLAAALAGSHDVSVELVATHLERAGAPGEALSALLAAADEGANAGSVGRAATLHLGAHQLATRHESLAAKRELTLRMAIGDLFAAGRWSELDPLLKEAWPSRRRLDSPTRSQLAAIAGWTLYWSGAIRESWALLEAEVAELEQTGDLEEAAQLLTAAGTIAWWARGDADSARRFLNRALEITHRDDDAELETRARCTSIMVTYGSDRRADVAAAALRDAASFAHGQGWIVGEAIARLYLAFVTWTMEDAKAALVFSARTGAWYGSSAILNASWLHLFAGRRKEAEDIFGHSRAELRLSAPTLAVVANAIEACLFLHRGDLNEARQLLESPIPPREATQDGWFSAPWSGAQGWLAWEEQRWADATDHLSHAAEQCAVGNNVAFGGRPVFVPMHVDAHLRLGQAAEAEAVLVSSMAFARKDDLVFEAALAAARFRRAPSGDAALEAEQIAGSAPWPWLKALVGCWRGDLLSDAQGAEQARKLFEQIGARRGVQRAERILRRLGVWPTGRGGIPSSLSARELEVAELVAQGLSNPAIARRLYLSRPTVATHVAHILTKLDFSSRAEIAAWIGERRTPRP